MNRASFSVFITAALAAISSTGAPAGPGTSLVDAGPAPKSALDFTMKDIDGTNVPLSKYKGNVVLIVNTASKCGFTPQYQDLQALYEKYKDQGLKIIAFPSNDFLPSGAPPKREDDFGTNGIPLLAKALAFSTRWLRLRPKRVTSR